MEKDIISQLLSKLMVLVKGKGGRGRKRGGSPEDPHKNESNTVIRFISCERPSWSKALQWGFGRLTATGWWFFGPDFLVVVVDDHDDAAPRVRPQEKEVGSVDARKKQDYSSKETNKLIFPRHLPCNRTIGRLITNKRKKKNYLSSAQSDKTRWCSKSTILSSSFVVTSWIPFLISILLKAYHHLHIIIT